MQSIVGNLLAKAPIPIGDRDEIFAPLGTEPPRTLSLRAMEAQSTVFAIIDGIATEMAAAQWALYRKAKSGDPEDRERVEVHPALTVWRKPNPFYTQAEFVETISQHNELAGEWWWVLARSNRSPQGPPIEIWPVRPDRMSPAKHPRHFITGYRYRAGAEEIPLRVDQVVFNRRPNPMDPYRGLGPVGSLILDMEGEHAAALWNRQFFRAGAEPGGLLKTKQDLSSTQFDELLRRWRQSHRGVNNAHRVGVLEGDYEWIERKYTQRDMQFEQLRRYSREMIRNAWRFPKPLLGDVEDVNRANADAADATFAKRLIMPRLNRLRTSLNDDFLPLFGPLGEGYEFDYLPVVPPNPEQDRADFDSKVNAAVALVAQGFDAEDTMAKLGLPAITHTGSPEPLEG